MTCENITYCSSDANRIMIPAGISQGDYFHLERPMYLNFGGIGRVIGHELTHGFDTNGKIFDEEGKHQGKKIQTLKNFFPLIIRQG